LKRGAVTELQEVVVSQRHVGGRIEDGRAGEEAPMARDEQQRLLTAHALADRVDPPPVDAHATAWLRLALAHLEAAH
jgi:hypothetical protein